MNLTIGNGKLNTRQALNPRYVAAACGLALAAGAFIGLSSLDGGSTAASVPARSAAVLAAPQRGPDYHTVFIAASEQQARDTSASVLQELDPFWYRAYSFVVVTTPAEEAAVRYAISEAGGEEQAVPMKVIDLR
jgi:hypothetical protein